MGARVAVAVALALCASTAVAAEGSARDRAAIEAAIENWNQAWKVKDPALAARDYAEDADWTNAFGMSRKGRADIQALLVEVFARDFVMAGDSRTVEQTVRFLKPDVALVTTRVERTGQRAADGQALPTRKTSHLRVLVRTGKAWRITSHLISDARDTERPGH